MRKLTIILLSAFCIFFGTSIFAQCADEANIYSFSFNDSNYEVVKENLSWEDAAACAVERGGYLAHIESEEEQSAVFTGVLSAGINPANTIAPDGGNASYVWLGGNDLGEEGKWVWDGNNDGNGVHFFQGKYPNGQAVDDAYVNWGNEPDNWGSQNGLGLAITDWPLGVSGQWNDVAENNELYYVIEFEPEGINTKNEDKVLVYPNPATDIVTIVLQEGERIISLELFNNAGSLVFDKEIKRSSTASININEFPSGVYFVKITLEGGKYLTEELIFK